MLENIPYGCCPDPIGNRASQPQNISWVAMPTQPGFFVEPELDRKGESVI